MNAVDKIKSVLTLNDDQIDAITSVEGPLLIIAGPGTGKTLTLVGRTLYLLLTEKAKPEEIILTTFTEKAAFELKERVSQLAKKLNYKENLNQLKVQTIHSLCNDYILKFLNHTPLKKGYTVLNELTQQLFIYEKFEDIVPVTTDGNYYGRWREKWYTIKKSASYFNKITEEMIDPKLSSSTDFINLLFIAYRSYESELFGRNKVDFAHLQKIFYNLLQNEKIYPEIKQKIKYIMVDEYQDTNYIQEKIMIKLATPENNICVVGDEDQALYRFRGATVRNILEFPKNFPNCKQVKLSINYRSHKSIIEKYNKFINSIKWNKFRYPKQIEPNPNENFPDYPAVFCIWGHNEKDEAERFVGLIKFLKENKIIQDWSDIALLLRSVKSDSDHYIQALKNNNIPYFSPRAKKFFDDNEEIKLLVACYAVIFSFKDGCKDLLDDYPHKDYIRQSLELLKEKTDENPALKEYLKRKVKQIENLQKGSLDLNVLDYFYQLLAFKPFSSFLKDKYASYNLSIFTKLISMFQEYYNIKLVTSKNKDIIKYKLFKSFLNFLIDKGLDEYEDPNDPIPKGYVQIMTIHQSKGLEFPVVLVGSLHKDFSVDKQIDRDLLPFLKRGIFETEQQMTEFDRLRHYYVAFSRAQKILVLTCPETPKKYFSPIWEGLDQYPYIEKDKLKEQKFASKPQFVPKRSYSFTHINAYETCPQQYLFFKELDFQPSRSTQILFGTLVHHTIEDLHKASIEGKKITRKNIEKWFESNYQALLLTGLRPLDEKRKKTALKHVLKYFEQNKNFLKKIKDTEVDVHVENNDYIITGKIDLLMTNDNKLSILDFKTQKKTENDSQMIDRYTKQLYLYAYLIKEKYGNPVEKMYIYWTAEDNRKNALMELRYDEREVENAGKYFDGVVQKIKKEQFTVETQPDTEKVCKECDLRFYCSQNGIIKFKTKELEEV